MTASKPGGQISLSLLTPTKKKSPTPSLAAPALAMRCQPTAQPGTSTLATQCYGPKTLACRILAAQQCCPMTEPCACFSAARNPAAGSSRFTRYKTRDVSSGRSPERPDLNSPLDSPALAPWLSGMRTLCPAFRTPCPGSRPLPLTGPSDFSELAVAQGVHY